MKIALSSKANEFTEALRDGLQKALPKDDWVEWSEDGHAEVEVLLAMGPVSREQMEASPSLVLVQTLSDGYDAVDVEAATELGVYVSYAPAEETGNAESVAEYAVMLLLAASRRLNEALTAVGRGEDLKLVNPTLAGKTVLIAGLGAIGSMIVDRLRPFEVRLLGVDRTPTNAPRDVPTRPLDELKDAVGAADYVVICLRGSKENTHLFGADMFAAMKRGATLVNVARGSLVDDAALAEAVRSGQIGAAGLDVTGKEPLPVGDPLLALPQVFVTPHIAGNTDLNLEGTVRYVAGIVEKYREGKKIASVLEEPKKPRGQVKA